MHALYTVSWRGILTSYSLLRTPQLDVNHDSCAASDCSSVISKGPCLHSTLS